MTISRYLPSTFLFANWELKCLPHWVIVRRKMYGKCPEQGPGTQSNSSLLETEMLLLPPCSSYQWLIAYRGHGMIATQADFSLEKWSRIRKNQGEQKREARKVVKWYNSPAVLVRWFRFVLLSLQHKRTTIYQALEQIFTPFHNGALSFTLVLSL